MIFPTTNPQRAHSLQLSNEFENHCFRGNLKGIEEYLPRVLALPLLEQKNSFSLGFIGACQDNQVELLDILYFNTQSPIYLDKDLLFTGLNVIVVNRCQETLDKLLNNLWPHIENNSPRMLSYYDTVYLGFLEACKSTSASPTPEDFKLLDTLIAFIEKIGEHITVPSPKTTALKCIENAMEYHCPEIATYFIEKYGITGEGEDTTPAIERYRQALMLSPLFTLMNVNREKALLDKEINPSIYKNTGSVSTNLEKPQFKI